MLFLIYLLAYPWRPHHDAINFPQLVAFFSLHFAPALALSLRYFFPNPRTPPPP